MPSGDQWGMDGLEDPRPGAPRRAMQAKRYGEGSTLNIGLLLSEMDRAVEDAPTLDAWVLATTKPLLGKAPEQLRRHAERLGWSFILLDWVHERPGLPRLAVLCGAYPDLVGHQVSNAARAELATIAAHPEFAIARERLIQRLSAVDVGFEPTRREAVAQLDRIYADANEARRVAGPSPAWLAEAAPVPRATLTAALDTWWTNGHRMAALLGEEGAGKTWAALAALRRLGSEAKGPLPLVISSDTARTCDDAIAAVICALQRLAEQQGLSLQAPDQFWRRRLDLWSRAPADQAVVILVLVDGLDEARDIRWAQWLSSLLTSRWGALFRVVATCRKDDWERELALKDVESLDCETLAVPRFTVEERDAYLLARDIPIEELSAQVLHDALHPRTAFHLGRLARDHPDLKRITRELLMLLDFKNRSLVKDGQVLRDDQFARLVRDLATAAQEQALRQKAFVIEEGDVVRRAAALTGKAPEAMQPLLSELISGRWCQRDADEPGQLTFADRMLPFAIGMALANSLRRLGREDAERELATFLDPWGADDIAEGLLRACAVILTMDAAVNDDLCGLVLRKWLNRAFHDHAAQDVWRRLHVFRPKLFLDLCETEGGSRFEALSAWGVASLWEDHPVLGPMIVSRLTAWLAATPLPRQRGTPGTPNFKFENHARRLQLRRAGALRKLGHSAWADLLDQELAERATSKASAAIHVIALLPRAPFLEAITAWALGGAMAGASAHQEDMDWVLRDNGFDPEATIARLQEAAAGLASLNTKISRRAAALMLRATGLADHARQAEELRTRPKPRSWSPGLAQDPDGTVWEARPQHRPSADLLLRELARFAPDPQARLSTALEADLARLLAKTPPATWVGWFGDDAPALAALARWHRTGVAGNLGAALTSPAAPAKAARESVLAPSALPILDSAGRRLAAERNAGAADDTVSDTRRRALRISASSSFADQVVMARGSQQVELLVGLLHPPTPAEVAEIIGQVDFRANEADLSAALNLAVRVLAKFDTPASYPVPDWGAGFTHPKDGFRQWALRLAMHLKDKAASDWLVTSRFQATDYKDQPTRFLGSDLLLLQDDKVLAPLIPHLEPDACSRIVTTRPALAEAALDQWEVWFRSKLCTARASHSFGGEYWWYKDSFAAHAAFCTKRPAVALEILQSTWDNEATRRNISWDHGEGPAWPLAVAISPQAPELVKRMWRATVEPRNGSHSDRVDHLPSRLPAGELFDDLRAEMLDLAVQDDETFRAVRALERNGHQRFVIDHIVRGLASARALDQARAVTRAGFLQHTPEADALWEALLSAPLGPGWLDDVQAAARAWYENGRWARVWGLRLFETADETEAWAAYILTREVADGRYYALWSTPPFATETGDWRGRWLNADSEARTLRLAEIEKPLKDTFCFSKSPKGLTR